MRNLDIADTRTKLELYASQGTLLAHQTELVGELRSGGAAQIAELDRPRDEHMDETMLDRAAMEFGVD